jgi:hypothetical protein
MSVKEEDKLPNADPPYYGNVKSVSTYSLTVRLYIYYNVTWREELRSLEN